MTSSSMLSASGRFSPDCQFVRMSIPCPSKSSDPDAIGNRYVRREKHTPIAQVLNQDLAINCPISAIICLVLQNKHKFS